MSAHFRWEDRCLTNDPFAGDFGGSNSSDGILSDKMVTNRGGGTCSTCGGQCEPGTRNRVRTQVYDGEFMRFRWCVHCCFAMAVFDIRPSILERRIPGQDFGEAVEYLGSTPQTTEERYLASHLTTGGQQ